MELFKCCRCKEFLPRDSFGGVTKRNDYCKPCKQLIETAYRADPEVRQRRNAQNRKAANKRYIINRNNLVEYLRTHPCIQCGESDPIVLEFDHIDRSTKRAQIGDILGSWNWNTILIEIEKCVVRCANCHRRKSHKELGWYTKEVVPYGTSLD